MLSKTSLLLLVAIALCIVKAVLANPDYYRKGYYGGKRYYGKGYYGGYKRDYDYSDDDYYSRYGRGDMAAEAPQEMAKEEEMNMMKGRKGSEYDYSSSSSEPYYYSSSSSEPYYYSSSSSSEPYYYSSSSSSSDGYYGRGYGRRGYGYGRRRGYGYW